MSASVAWLPGIRLTNFIIFLGCVGLMLVGLYMQYFMGLVPCALCITQRVFIIATGLWALIAVAVHHPVWARRTLAVLGILSSIAGGFFSSRQLWLQSLPEGQAPACGPSLNYLLDAFPLQEALTLLLRGDGNCAEISWTFLGISIPGWTLVAFIGLVLFNLWQLLRRN
ncbi:disulfide bond formation protein B [Sessilibacter sp. MAH2]|mgnify:CR=1 FL=1